jgi:hypothetical protein
MENHIYVSSYSTRGIHFGLSSNYQNYEGNWFEEKNNNSNNSNNFIYKSIITSIDYLPDSIYCTTDGYGGTCWCAKIIDSDEGINYYHFRNFEDLVQSYEAKGYKFVGK